MDTVVMELLVALNNKTLKDTVCCWKTNEPIRQKK